MLQEEKSVISNFLNNDIVALLVAEANRLPAPYGSTLGSIVGAVGPMLVDFINKKLADLSPVAAQSVAPAVAAPAAVIVPQS